jgi:uncharacterized protein
MACEAFFMASPDGQRFCLYHPPQTQVLRGRVLYIHPLAEELNKSRRMAALQARALAAAGYAVLQIDLLGCGDSSGDFGDARWDAWVTDIVRACAWLRLRVDATAAPIAPLPLWLWGLRAGCLLAQQAALHLDEVCHFLLWQPPWTGRAVLQQFLRLQLAGQMLGGASTGGIESLRQQLLQGQSIEVAGYRLSANLAQGLERARLTPPSPAVRTQRVVWFELSSLQPPRLSCIPEEARAPWCRPGLQLVRRALYGPAFWQGSGTDEAPALLAATSAALCTPSL